MVYRAMLQVLVAATPSQTQPALQQERGVSWNLGGMQRL